MASLSAVEARLYIPGLTTTAEDTPIGVLITRADAAIARWLGYPPASAGATPTFEDTSYTWYTDRGDARVVRLDAYNLRMPVRPVVSVTSITEDATWAFTGSAVSSSDYTLFGDEGLVRLKQTSTQGAWSSAEGAQKVVAVAGYATVPDDLKDAAGKLVKHWWDLRKTQGMSSVSAGGATESRRDETLPAAVVELLWPFRLGRAVL